MCRPPGHHATRTAFGGSCYLNNAAVAAEGLRAAGAARVAVIDIDAHHGNGTQALFYDRADVLFGSLHVDPAAGWFPHYIGFADETGRGDGDGANLNLPLAEGTGDGGWLRAVERLVAWAAQARVEAVVVSLGVDAAADDPESPLRVSARGLPAGRTPARRSWTGRPSPCRRAATTCRRSGRSSPRRWPGSRRSGWVARTRRERV